jgi:hypothetical protein
MNQVPNRAKSTLPILALASAGSAVGLGGPEIADLATNALAIVGVASASAAISTGGSFTKKFPNLSRFVGNFLDVFAFNFNRASNKVPR